MGVLLGNEGAAIRCQFVENYEQELDRFVSLMEEAFREWSRADKTFTKSGKESEAYVSAMLYAALHSHIVALRLFISGLFVPSGNTQRYAIECAAMAFLLSRPSLGVSKRYIEGQYSTNKAVRDLVRNHEVLKLSRESLKTVESRMKFYDKFSHLTQLSLGGVINLGGNEAQIIFGGAYDPGKTVAYERELESRVGLARIFPNLIQGVELNFLHEA